MKVIVFGENDVSNWNDGRPMQFNGQQSQQYKLEHSETFQHP